MSLTATQKIRQTLTGSPDITPTFPHEGDTVVRWLTGGPLPDAWVTFHHEHDSITVRCAGCQAILGTLPADFSPALSVAAMTAIRQAGHESHKPVGWPRPVA